MAHALTDHETIRRWAEARGARPAKVRRSADAPAGLATGDLCLEIPGTMPAGAVDLISWHEWFRRFDENGLALLIENANRQPSTFNLLITRKELKSIGPVQSVTASASMRLGRSASDRE